MWIRLPLSGVALVPPSPSPPSSSAPPPSRAAARPSAPRARLQASQPAAQQRHRTSEYHPSPPPLTGARDRSQQRAACRARAACGRGAASPPAPGRRRSARPRPATHSWAHPLPCPTPPVRGAPAARSRLPSPGRMRPRAASPPAPARSRSARPRPATQCVTYLHHMPPLAGAQRRPGERRPAGPGPHAARCGTALQPVLGLKTGIGARGCVAHTPCNRNNTIPHGYKLLDVSPPESPGAGPARACGTSRAPPASTPHFTDFASI